MTMWTETNVLDLCSLRWSYIPDKAWMHLMPALRPVDGDYNEFETSGHLFLAWGHLARSTIHNETVHCFWGGLWIFERFWEILQGELRQADSLYWTVTERDLGLAGEIARQKKWINSHLQSLANSLVWAKEFGGKFCLIQFPTNEL